MNARFLTAALTLSAFLFPQDAGGPRPDLSELVSEPSAHARRAAALAAWRSQHGASWRAVTRTETEGVRFLYGGSAPAPAQPVLDTDFIALAQYWIRTSQDVHGIDVSSLIPERVAFLPLGAIGTTDKKSVSFRQELGGVAVENATTSVLFDLQGRLLAIDTTALPSTLAGVAGFDASPVLDAAAAVSEGKYGFASETGLPATSVSSPLLRVAQVLEEKHVTPRLVWEVRVGHEPVGFEPEAWTYQLDAKTGARVSRRNAIHHFDVSGTVQSMATPGAEPDGSSNPEVPLPMPHLTVTSAQGNAVTDSNGNFTIAGASAPLSVTVEFTGTYATLDNNAGAEYSLTQTLNSASGNTILMNPSSSALVTAEANAFNWIGLMRDWTRATNPSDATSDFNAFTNVNINSTCNAFYNGVSTNYYLAGGGCVNTAYSSVVLHEMGHWLNDLYSSGNGSDGFGEGNADVFSMYVLDDPIVGFDFCGTGCHIRDGNNTRQYCGDGNGGCYGGVHADGEVLMGALWKVRTRLKNAHGTASGGAIADGLFNAWMNAYNDSTINSIIETHWLTLDDDNGNIGDGTPNYAHIDGGFVDQGFPGVGLDFLTFSNVTQLGNTQDEVGPYNVQADVTAILNPPVSAVDLFYRVDGGAFTQVSMSLVSGSTYSGDIPGQVSPAVVEYYLTAEDSNFQTDAFPDNAPQSTLRFVVGIETIYYSDDFEAGINGWTHVSNNGAQDDWQRSADVGATNGSFGQSGDPPFAPSPINIWGNDLGPPGFNGAYQSGVDNSLRSPVIDLSGATGTMLRFKRWLTIEDGQFDQARVLLNGTQIWSNAVGSDTVDTAWVDMNIDISGLADGNASVQLEWNLITDGSVVFGGWNIDDVEIVSLEASSITAEFSGAPTSGSAPLNVQFTDQSSGAPTAWSWTFGDGGSSAVQNPSHTYGTPGTYSVALTATGTSGSDTLTKTDYIVVTEPAPVAEFVASTTSGVEPLSVSFTDLSSGAVSAWAWDFGDGGSASTQNPAHTYIAAGTYTVSLTASGPGGSDGEVKLDYIVVTNAPPVAEFVASTTSGVEPLSVSFTDLSSGVVSAWAWDFGDGGSASTQNPAYTYLAAGTYTVSLTASGPGGSDGEVKLDYIVVTNAPPVAEFVASTTSGVEPLSVSFTDLSSGAVSAWAWDFGDGGSASTQNPAHTYIAAGTYTVSLTASGPGGSDGEVKLDYIVVTNAPPVAEFVASTTSGVEPLSVSFTDLSSGVVSAWAWDFGDGGSASTQNPAYTYLAAGTYTVSLTASGPGGSDGEVKLDYIVVTNAPPVAEFVASTTSGVEPLSVSFTDLSSGAVSAWAWDFGDGGSASTQNPAHTYIAAGTYTVSLTASGPGGSDGEVKLDYIVVTNAPPVAEFVASTTSGVEPLSVSFTDLSTGLVTSWTWDFGDGGSASTQNPAYTYLAAGTYTVSLTASGPGGSDGEVKLDYIVVTNAPPVAEFVASTTSGVEPLSVSFTDLSSGVVSAWAWDFGDGGSASTQNPAYTYIAAGTYTVSLTASGPGGSDGEVKLDYIVVTNAPPVASFTASEPVGPAPHDVTFTDTSTGAIDAWTWDFGDGNGSSLQSPSHSYLTPGTYSVSLQVDGPGGSDSVTQVDLVVVQIPASATIRNGSGTNTLAFTSLNDPVIGTTWNASIDVGHHAGATLTFVLGYDTPLAGISTPYGELLIANEVLGGVQLAVTSAPPVGSTALHSIPVPNDPTVEGFPVYFQGLILGGGPEELLNALDVVLGY